MAIFLKRTSVARVNKLGKNGTDGDDIHTRPSLSHQTNKLHVDHETSASLRHVLPHLPQVVHDRK
jgi:hypothetical protein